MGQSNKKTLAREIICLRLRQMLINELYKIGRIRIPIHFAFGYESLAVAVGHAMKYGDSLILSHRNIAYHMARDDRFELFLDEYLLQKTGLSKGRFGSMNLINPTRGVLYTSSILANQFPVACGVALGSEICGFKSVTWVSGGDGAVEEGAFYESLLLARSIDAPVVFLIENNEWSMHTQISERRKPIDLRTLSDSLGVKFYSLAGNNPYDYLKKLLSIRKQALSIKVPACVEIKMKTLGDWIDRNNLDYPGGKFVKYHTGPSPSTTISKWPLMKESEDDPLYVLTKIMPVASLKKIAERQFKALTKYL